MSFDLVSRDLLVKIFHRLPFKDRVHLRCVNLEFNYASNESISKMKSLVVNKDLMTYTAKTQSLASLLESCAPTLESIDVSSYSHGRLVVKEIADFVYPKLKQLKIMDADEDQMKKLLSRNRNLRSIALHMSRMKFEWPADYDFKNLEELDLLVSEEGDLRAVPWTTLFPTLCPLISKARNLKRISIKAGFRPAKMSSDKFKDLLATVPRLESLSLHGRDCFMLGLFSIRTVQLPSLAFLKINHGSGRGQPPQFHPLLLSKFPTSFPRLKSIISDGWKEVDYQAIVALSQLQHLRELRLPYLEMTKQEFIKMVDRLPSLAVLEIGAIKSVVQMGVHHQVGGQTNNGAVVAPSQPTNLQELHVHEGMAKAVLIDVITRLQSIAVLQIDPILDVLPESFFEFLMTTAALFRPNLEIRLFMPPNGVQFDLEMKAALKELELNGGPVITFNPHRTRN